MNFRVGAVIAAYRISWTELQPLLAAILPQVTICWWWTTLPLAGP